MVGSKLTLTFMEFEIRQFASAFSISSLVLAASLLVASVIVARPARSATARNVVIKQILADVTKRSSGDQMSSCP